jgi:DNA modification methylase
MQIDSSFMAETVTSSDNHPASELKTSEAGKLKIVYRAIDSLTPYKGNSRTHSRSQIRKLRKSLIAFGFTNPILITATGMIIAGHGRWEAAKLLGMTEVPTVCLEDLSPDQVRAYVIADNRLALDAGWDLQLLKIELQHLISLPEFDIELTGFEVPEIDLVISAAPAEEDPDDQLPEESSTIVTKPGDLWRLGDHRILCADAREAGSFNALMGDKRASVIFTDPPYNVAIDGHASGNGRIHHQEFAMASGEMSEAQFTEFLATSLKNHATYSIDGSVHFVAMDWRHLLQLFEAGRDVYDKVLNLCVWSKDNGGMGSFYRSQHEMFVVFKSGKGAHRNNIQLGKYGRNRTNLWNYPGANTLSRSGSEGNLLAMHPTVKPVALVADAILDCSARGEIVLDGFLGAGSTLLAAERVGRICCGVEIESRYVDLAIRRWQQMTGEKAYLEATGEAFDDLADKEARRG